jgi:hypothetical protein
VLGCTETPLSSSSTTATFAPQLLLLTCRAISASPPPLGLRKLTVRGSSKLTASDHHLHTSSLWTSSPCMIILLPPVVRPALTSALPRRRSLRDRPCQGTAVRDLIALRVGLSRSATPHFRPRTSEPRASLARIALLLTCLKPPCMPLLTPDRKRTPVLVQRLGSVPLAAQHLPTPPTPARHTLGAAHVPLLHLYRLSSTRAPASPKPCRSRAAAVPLAPGSHRLLLLKPALLLFPAPAFARS